MTYEDLKNSGKAMHIAGWLKLDEKLPSYPFRVIGDPRKDFAVVGETEKAVKVQWQAETADGEREFAWTAWCPKSAIESLEEAESKKQAYRDAHKEEWAKRDEEYRLKVLAWCKSKNMKYIKDDLSLHALFCRIGWAKLDKEFDKFRKTLA